MTATEITLTAAGRVHHVAPRWLMGIVNASPDSFSDGGDHPTVEAKVRHGLRQHDDGAHVIDVGGQSGVTGVPEVDPEVESDLVTPVIAGLVDGGVEVISVDTYKPLVVERSIAAGAAVINDVSGLRDPEVAGQCADLGAALVIMHNRTPPKVKLRDPDLYDDVVDDVVRYLTEKMEVARDMGLGEESIILDPGPDFAKTALQTVEVLRHLDRVVALGRPVVLALSRKDFIGAINRTRPKERLAGTLGAIGAIAHHPGCILRVHDVRAVREFLEVNDAVAGRAAVSPSLELDVALRKEPITPTS